MVKLIAYTGKSIDLVKLDLCGKLPIFLCARMVGCAHPWFTWMNESHDSPNLIYHSLLSSQNTKLFKLSNTEKHQLQFWIWRKYLGFFLNAHEIFHHELKFWKCNSSWWVNPLSLLQAWGWLCMEPTAVWYARALQHRQDLTGIFQKGGCSRHPLWKCFEDKNCDRL